MEWIRSGIENPFEVGGHWPLWMKKPNDPAETTKVER